MSRREPSAISQRLYVGSCNNASGFEASKFNIAVVTQMSAVVPAKFLDISVSGSPLQPFCFQARSHNFEKKKSLLASSCLSVCNTSARMGWIFIKFDIWNLFENMTRKFNFHYNPTRITSNSHDEISTFVTISR